MHVSVCFGITGHIQIMILKLRCGIIFAHSLIFNYRKSMGPPVNPSGQFVAPSWNLAANNEILSTTPPNKAAIQRPFVTSGGNIESTKGWHHSEIRSPHLNQPSASNKETKARTFEMSTCAKATNEPDAHFSVSLQNGHSHEGTVTIWRQLCMIIFLFWVLCSRPLQSMWSVANLLLSNQVTYFPPSVAYIIPHDCPWSQ